MIECPIKTCEFIVESPRGSNTAMDDLLRMWHHVVNNHKLVEDND